MPKTKKINNQEQGMVKEVKTKTKKTSKTTIENNLIIKVYGLDGKEEESMDLSKEIFNVKINDKLLSQYVRVYLANQRQGTASTKTRGEVTGSTRKIYRQKGTGKARHGDIKAPIFVGGGIVGGPTPRDYSLKMNKKQIRKALLSALSLKLKENNIIGLSNKAIDIEPKTKIMANLLKSLAFYNNKVLLVLPKLEKNNLILAVRNLHNIKYFNIENINPYQILTNGKLLVLKEALTSLQKNLLKNNEN